MYSSSYHPSCKNRHFLTLYFRAYSLFYDESRSVQFLAEYQKEFLFNEDITTVVDEDSEDEEETKKDETSNMETNDS